MMEYLFIAVCIGALLVAMSRIPKAPPPDQRPQRDRFLECPRCGMLFREPEGYNIHIEGCSKR